MSSATAPSQFAAIDCLPLPAHFSGAAYYIYHLTHHLLGLPRNLPLAIVCKPGHRELFEPMLQPGDKIVTVPVRNRAEQLLNYERRLPALLQKENIRLFYATHYMCPPRRESYTIVNTFHDLGFLRFPRYYPLIKQLFFGRQLRQYVRRSDHVVTVSQATNRDFLKFFPEMDGKTSVIYPGTDHLSSVTPADVTRDRPFFLAVNTFEVRKNLPRVVELFDYLKSEYQLSHQLILVGHPANGYRKLKKTIRKSEFNQDIVLATSIPVDTLKRYYLDCSAFINMSSFEGFGFTPMEAVREGCRVFLYRNAVVAEIMGTQPGIFEHLSIRQWGDHIANCINKSHVAPDLSTLIQPLSWQNCARAILKKMEALYSRADASKRIAV